MIIFNYIDKLKLSSDTKYFLKALLVFTVILLTVSLGALLRVMIHEADPFFYQKF